MAMYCPYCDTEINDKLIEQEDGCCPECGAFISASMVINEDDEYDEYGEDDLGGDDGLGGDDDLGDMDLNDLGDDMDENEEY